jgi:hypothetical protein
MAEMRKLTSYFNLLCEESKWDQHAEKVFDDLFHPDVKIQGKRETFDFAEWKEWFKRSVADNLIFEVEKVAKTGPDSIVYSLRIHTDEGILSHTAKGIFKDGKLIRTEPVDPSAYDLFTKKKRRQPVVIL